MNSQNNSKKAHQQKLKEAIYQLPDDVRQKTVFSSIKLVFGDKGKTIAQKWLKDNGKSTSNGFQNQWNSIHPSPYQKKNLGNYLKGMIYDRVVSKNSSKTKANKQIKSENNHVQLRERPTEKAETTDPSQTEMANRPDKMVEKESEDQNKDENQQLIQLVHSGIISSEEKVQSYEPMTILNLYGAVYLHPHKDRNQLLKEGQKNDTKLVKLVDCEVRVLEATEIVRERQGRQTDDLEVRYTLLLDNYMDKKVRAEITYEELTTKTKFSRFLVKHGFVKFYGSGTHFDWFHEFLINKQKYPTIRVLSSWGEFRPGEFIFENGIFSTDENKFIPLHEIGGIPYKGKLLVCPSGSEQVRPPKLSMPEKYSAYFLADKFKVWEELNGPINVRVTLGYAVACVFSQVITEKLSGFPILFKFGVRGTGKSSSMDWFMSLFGYPGGNRQSITKQNTIKGVLRRMTLPKSFPFFLDDYRDSEKNSNSPDLTNSFLNWYHRIGTGMAAKTTDNQTIDTPMKACVVMTGNDKPTDEASVSRVIVLNYNEKRVKNLSDKVSEIDKSLYKFSEFLYLLLEKYEEVGQSFFDYLHKNKKDLEKEGFDGRTVNNWAVILAGIQCLEIFIPFLSDWNENFSDFRQKIYGVIRKELTLQESANILHEFFFVMQHYATQKKDPESDQNSSVFVLDHRHFRKREGQSVRVGDTETYRGSTLAIHLRRIWNVLEDMNAPITRKTNYEVIASSLENSSYFLDKSVQVPLTKSIHLSEEGNVRCYLLNVDEITEKGLMDDLLEKAEKYEINRKNRIIK